MNAFMELKREFRNNEATQHKSGATQGKSPGFVKDFYIDLELSK